MKTRNRPPEIFLRFFRWFCDPKMRDYIEGDLFEVFNERIKKSGKRTAEARFIIDVLLLFRPGIIRSNTQHHSINNYAMFKSYMIVGWRNLRRNGGYSFVNIGGLAIGMAVAILNGLWIWDELSFNKYFVNHNTIAHVSETVTEDGRKWVGTTMMYPLATELMENYGNHFERIARTSWIINPIVSVHDKHLTAKGLFADATMPEMFTFEMVYGTRAALKRPQSVMLSASLSKMLFGEGDPLNKVLRLNNKMDVTVTGVYKDFPMNTNFADIKMFGSWDLYLIDNPWIEQRALTDWRNHFIKIYAQIPSGADFQAVENKVKRALRFDPLDAERAAEQNKQLYLYPMSDWHLFPYDRNPVSKNPIEMIRLVGAIGIFVLLLACINFMNLSTARSERRAKEVGIRKSIGSVRSQLINQFFSESLLVVVFAFILAITLSSLCLPWFNDISMKQISMPWTNVSFWAVCIAFILVTSLLAGSYPAFFLSSFNPVKVLKGTYRVGRLGSIPRKVLVVVQFTISVTIIIGTSVVYQQVQFAKNRPVGYSREGLIMIEKKSADFYNKFEVLRTELKNTGAVKEVSESMGAVTEVVSGNNGWDWAGRHPHVDESFVTHAVSPTHGKTAGWEFVAGRDLSPELYSDSSGLIINETAARFMEMSNPIGQPVTWTWWNDKRKLEYNIIGVIKDMVMESPYAPAEPTVFYLKGFNGGTNWINIRLKPDVTTEEALSRIEIVFRKVVPNAPFEYKFADQEYAIKFAEEERLGKLTSIFAVLAVFISCLGLSGLASFLAEQRTKEIGIRKILGATIENLWRLLSRDFVFLVLTGCAIAVPVAGYLTNQWLQKYSYRIEVSPWTFVIPALVALLVTLATVSFQAIKVARTNPVKSLKSE